MASRLGAQRCPSHCLTRAITFLRKPHSARTASAHARSPLTERTSSSEGVPIVAPAKTAVEDNGVPGWQQLVLLSALVAVICSVDRAAISVTILPMSAEFLWDDSTKGLISSAFFIGCGFLLARHCVTFLHTACQSFSCLKCQAPAWVISDALYISCACLASRLWSSGTVHYKNTIRDSARGCYRQ
jgi:hypothetical protein